jgi:hypothetical protein
MKSVQLLATVFLLLSTAAAQANPAAATVQSVKTAQNGDDLRVEIRFTAPVNFSVETAENPDRILLDIPDAVCTDKTKMVAVNSNGVRRVRTGQHSTTPLVTRIVLDLDHPLQYAVSSDGNVVVLTVSPGKPIVARSTPVAATSGNLAAIFHRHHDAKPVIDTPADVPPPVQAPAVAQSSQAPVDNTKADSTPTPPPVVQRPKIPASLQSSPSRDAATNSAVTDIPSVATVQSMNPASSAKNDMPALPVAVAAPKASTSTPDTASNAKSDAPIPPLPVAPAKPSPSPADSAATAKNDVSIPPVPTVAKEAPPASNPNPVPVTPPPAVSAPETSTIAKSETPAPPAPVTAQPTPAPTVNVAATSMTPPTSVAVPAPAPVAAAPVSTVAANSAPPVTETAPEALPAVAASSEAAAAASSDASASTVTVGPVPLSTAETSTLIARADDPNLHTVFKVKYVAEGVAYLEGGRAQGLAEGMKLLVIDTNLPATQGTSANAADPRVIAELEVSAVADTSSVSDIHTPKRPVKVGDLAYLSTGDTEAMVQQRTLSATRQYPAVVSFTEGDTLDEEVRDFLPKPPLPSVNRARGRIGFDSIETISHGTSSVTSTDLGMVFRGDITRIGGTYWNLSGYWRGRLTKESVQSQQTLQNLLNRTYHLNMTYDNPNSPLVAGFGRLYLPWAPSLDTIDGGYFGGHISKGTTLGIFGGSTPDPSSWDYSPNRAIGGAFINFEGGEFNGFHYSSTAGAGISMLSWQIDRPFVFIEDNISYKRGIAIYESAQADDPRGNSATPSPGPGLGRNFSTLRLNPHARIEMDFNYNYFRDIPTFDPNLVGTSLLDKYLFQGFSAGGRVEVINQVWLSTNLGRSSGTGDAKTSLNQMYGITFGRLPFIGLRADGHYAKFSGSFGNGSYESISLSRQLRDRLRLEVLVGQQNFISTLTSNTRGRFVTGTIETTLGPHYYLQSNFTTNRGDMSYDQMMFSIGYRFDTKQRRRE